MSVIGTTEWSGGVIKLIGPPGSQANGINNAGQVVVGFSGGGQAPESNGGSAIDLGACRAPMFSQALGINDAGRAVGVSGIVPEPSTWAMNAGGLPPRHP